MVKKQTFNPQVKKKKNSLPSEYLSMKFITLRDVLVLIIILRKLVIEEQFQI